MKRVGARGGDEWKTITWEELIKEVVHGGQIFADTTDKASQDLVVKGFKDLYEQRNNLLDPKNPEYGNVTNRFVLQAGRIVKSRKDFQNRFCKSFGTINSYEHTNICELSHHIATGEVYDGHHNAKVDLLETEFALFFGTAPGEANFPMQTMGKYSAEARANGCKIVVVDPVLPRTITSVGDTQWIAPKAGTDGALAAGVLQLMIASQGYNRDYLSYPSLTAAQLHGETNFTNATHLIVDDSTHPDYGQFLQVNAQTIVMADNGEFMAAERASQASLTFEGEYQGTRVTTAFNLLARSVNRKTIRDYAEESGIEEAVIHNLANDLMSHGRKAAVEFYRGIAQHPNGYYTGFLIHQINVLLGNLNWSGGLSLGGGGYDYNGGVYDLSQIPNLTPAAQGLHISREQMHYQDSSEYKAKVAAGQNPYPAPRPWFPLGTDVFSEILPSALEGYPYRADILMWHMCTPLYSTPSNGRDEIVEQVKDPKKIPLIIASDIVIGDSSRYADYVIPDLTYLEQYVHHPMMEATMVKGTAIRTPVVEPLTEKTQSGHHFSYEQFLIDVAKELGMAGFGDKAIPDTHGNLHGLHTMSDYYLKGVANAVHNFGPVPEISDEEIRIGDLDTFYRAHKHTLKQQEWLDVLFAISRGGLYEPVSQRRNGDKLTNQYNGMVSLYSDKVAKTINSQTGEKFMGYPVWQPSTTTQGTLVSELDEAFPLTILTKKTALQSHSRLSSADAIREITPTNYAEVNMQTGKEAGLETGDWVWVESVEGRRKAQVKLREGIAQNVVSFTIGFGHSGYGANDYHVNGKVIKGSKQRKSGFNLNPILRTDPDIWAMPLMDLVGGSSCFYDTKAKIYKV